MHHNADIKIVCTRYSHSAVWDLIILFQIDKLEKIFRLPSLHIIEKVHHQLENWLQLSLWSYV